MVAGTAQRMRGWSGPAVLSYGFRPFFLGGAVWAVVAMCLWIAMLTGHVVLPIRFDPLAWHAHEFLFGYLGAILAGFILTAVPNWTGRLPVTGWPLGALALLWLAGRVAVALSSAMPWLVVAAIDVAFPVALCAVILREIVTGKSWRNLMVLGLIAGFAVANALYHWQAAAGGVVAGGAGLRLGLAAGVMLISVIGGRVVPSFTRNWLVKAGDPARPAAPMQRFDKIVLLVSLAALLVWVAWPDRTFAGGALLGMGALHLARLARWKGWRTGREALVWVLHAGYAFVPLGALALGAAILRPGVIAPGAAQHLWMAGAIGLITLAVMTRATLGHTGAALHAGAGTCAIYLLMLGAVTVRLAAPVWPWLPLLDLAGLCWIGAFGGFAVLYGPRLLRPKPARA